MKFSLRSVLVSVAVVAAILAVCLDRYTRVSSVSAAVEKHGGTALFDVPLHGKIGLGHFIGADYIDLSNAITINDSAFRAIAKNPRKFVLHLEFANVTANQLHLLRGAKITELCIDGVEVGDDAVNAIAQMEILKVLSACDTAITAEGFQRLQTLLPKCEILTTRQEVCERGM